VHLARANVKSDRTGVVVLEVVESKVTRATDRIRRGLARRARVRVDGVRVTRRNAHVTEIARLGGLVVVCALLGSRRSQSGEANIAMAGNSVA
jgi:hypothetical protein